MTTAVDDALKIDIVGEVAKELALPLNKVTATADLLADGNTVPFIARYRKDVTGNLDEVQIRDIQAATKRLEDLQARKATVEKAITEQKAMTPNLMKALVAADTMQAVEDLYLPYKQKRRTKATIAKEAGLMPMAQFVQKFPAAGLQAEAAKFVDADKDLPDVAAVMEIGRAHV